MKLLQMTSLTEELSDYIADNSGLGYVKTGDGANFKVESGMQWNDVGRLLGNEILLTIFDEGGTLFPSARQTQQDRLFRFVTKGSHANQALDRGRDLVEWLWNTKTFLTPTFRIWARTPLRLPAVIHRGEGDAYLADFLMPFSAFSRRSG